jgi:hypothetical protein
VKFEPQRAQRTQREVATNSVLSVYSVAKEMIIMKMRCFSSEIRATESTENTEGSCYGLCALCVLCGKRDDYYEKGGVSREIRATEGTVQLTVIFKMLDDNESV